MGAAKEKTAGKKAFKMPHTLVIIFVIILAAVLFTWIVPSGEYARAVDAATGRELIDPESFHYVENTPVNPLRIMNYVIDGFLDAADLIFMLLFAGGAFHLITDSGALQASIAKVARKFSNRFYIFIPMLTLIFTLIATNQGVNLFIPFVPITVMLSFALGLDSLVGVSIILLGGAVGFSTGTLQTSTTLLAQEIAGLVPFSGIWYRAICLVVFWVITNIFLIRYAMRIKKNPQLSPMYDLDQQSEMKASTTDLSSFGELNWRRVAILAALVIVLAIIVYGGLTLDWDMAEFAAMFIWLAIVVGLLAGKSLSDIAKGIVAGSKTMLGACMIVGSARSIALILTDGGVMDTIVHFLAGGLDLVPTILQAPAMFLICTVFNVFMASGSGQAAVMMPLLLPVADLVGMSRQTVILAFNFGDGFRQLHLPHLHRPHGSDRRGQHPLRPVDALYRKDLPALGGGGLHPGGHRPGHPPAVTADCKGAILVTKRNLFARVEEQRAALSMADDIYDHPELGFQEFHAQKVLTDYLKDCGFQVELGTGGVETAFRAEFSNGQGGPRIGLLCEYDALEGLGHACGHHMQGPAIVGAAKALKECAGDKPFSVVVYGTPAEETAHGKLRMLEQGCFRDIDVALMMHGSPTTVDVSPWPCPSLWSPHGKRRPTQPDRRTAAVPDGLLMAFNGIHFLREHVPEDTHYHPTVPWPGFNVVPDTAEGKFMLRSYSRKSLDAVVERFKEIIQGAALIAGVTYDMKEGDRLANKIPVLSLNRLIMENAELVHAPASVPGRRPAPVISAT